MREIVAIEYREDDWEQVSQLVWRVEAVADAFVEAGVVAVELPGLLCGIVEPPSWSKGPAAWFGLRAHTWEAVVGFGAALSLRGYTGVVCGTDDALDDEMSSGRFASALSGLGLMQAKGGSRQLVGASAASIREALADASRRDCAGQASLWMPAPDRFGRVVDGLFVEEASRRGVDVIWKPGRGVNRQSELTSSPDPQIVVARRDDGTSTPDALARWARGDRFERGKARISGLQSASRRWLRELTGWEKR